MLLFFVMSGCYLHKNGLRKGEDYSQIKLASEVSFFGGFSATPSTKSNNNFLLLLKNDSLKFIAFGNHRLRKSAKAYKVHFLRDSSIMLTREFQGRYYTADTAIITQNGWYQKQLYYQDQPQALDYTAYVFTEQQDLLWLNNMYYSYTKDSLLLSMPFTIFSQNTFALHSDTRIDTLAKKQTTEDKKKFIRAHLSHFF